MRLIHAFVPLAAMVLVAQSASGQQAEEFGEYTVHYNTISTNLLPPEAARSYGIQRAASRALLNVAILRKPDNTPVRARVMATATNLVGQRREIPMQEVDDQTAIYYIGQFRIHDEETLEFQVKVVPRENQTPPMDLKFRQQFFTE